MREAWGWHHQVQGLSSTRVPWDSLVPEESGTGMVGWKRTSVSQAGKHSPGVGGPALPPKAWAERGSRAAGSLGGRHSQARARSQQRVSCERGTHLSQGLVSGGAVAQTTLWAAEAPSVLWHRARLWEQSWFWGLLGTGRGQGCAALMVPPVPSLPGHCRWLLHRARGTGRDRRALGRV